MCAIIIPTICDFRDIQPTLFDLIPELEIKTTKNKLNQKVKTRFSDDGKWITDLKILPNNRVKLVDNHCPHCKGRLWKNGMNKKIQYDFYLENKEIFFLQRYCCKKCGAIQIDYCQFFKNYGKYDKNLKNSMRLVFALGIPPCKIQEIAIALLTILIPLTTIKSWIYPLKNKITEVLYPRNMPCSGSLSHDEIHLNIAGKKAYLYVTVDCFTNLAIKSRVVPNIESASFKHYFKRLSIDQNIKINSLVTDGSNLYGSIFKNHSLKKIKRGRCHAHFKRNIREQLYKAAGLGKQIKKSLPPLYHRILMAFYYTIRAKTDFDFDIRLAMAQSLVNCSKNDKLQKPLGLIETSKDILMEYNYSPNLDKTTNRTESINNEIEVYRSFKKGQKTIAGAEFVSQMRIFIHNMRNLTYINPIIEKEDRYYEHLKESYGFCKGIQSLAMKHGWFKRKISIYRKGLEEFWVTYFPIKALNLFKNLWNTHH